MAEFNPQYKVTIVKFDDSTLVDEVYTDETPRDITNAFASYSSLEEYRDVMEEESDGDEEPLGGEEDDEEDEDDEEESDDE